MRFKRDPNTFVPHRTLKWTSACTKIFIYPDPHDPDPYIHTSFLSASLAIDEACRLAEIYGVGVVAVDNAFHYLWGAGYVMRAAEKGFIAFTTCTGAIPEGSAIGPRAVLPKMFGNTSSPVPFPLPQLCRTVALPRQWEQILTRGRFRQRTRLDTTSLWIGAPQSSPTAV